MIHNGNSKSQLTQLFKSNNDKVRSGECAHNQNDKSDLDSLNSEYFKNSSHQNETNVTPKVRLYQNHNNHKGKNNQFNKAIHRYQDNSQSSAFPESTTSITDTSSSTSNQSDNESSCKRANEEVCSTHGPKKNVIVYDTVYLSSEESSEDPSVLCKPVIISAVEKKLKTFSDYTKVAPKNILSNLSFINNIETKTNDNQYYSLPDCSIGQSLNISEKIDDNLRSSYNFRFSVEKKTLKKSDVITNNSNSRNNGNHSPTTEINTSVVKESVDKSSNVTIIVTDEQDNIIENTNTITRNIEILDAKKDIKSNSLRKNTIQSKSRGIQKSIVRAQSFKTMSRPQILQIFDTKRKLKQSSNNDEFVKAEFLDKVNSVKKFWSKLSDEPKLQNEQKVTESSSVKIEIEQAPEQSESLAPSIEIININEKKKPLIVDSEISNNDTEPLFDHVRYKVLKSNAIRNHIIVRNKKDINYGGLLQYLQEYRFQELLNNNNVVIVEPIRTKVDTRTANKLKKPTESSVKAPKIKNENTNTKKKNVEKHFFYQPIQVNREMHEDELPSPDIVRKTKQLFERVMPSRLIAKNVTNKLSFSSDNLDLGSRTNFHQTFYNHNSTIKRLSDIKPTSKERWDAFSVSSGISSGKHSPPCDCVFADEKFNENSEEIVKSNIDLSSYKSSIQKNIGENHTAHYISEVIYK